MESASSSSLSDLELFVDELIKCPICLDDVQDPKGLPCFHTFCHTCISNYCQDKSPEDRCECPVCRNPFTIPDEGVDQLPNNFFIKSLTEIKKITCAPAAAAVSDVCDGCCFDVPPLEATPATMFCMFCHQKLCERCAKPHRVIPGGDHQIVPYGKEAQVSAIELQRSYCSQHSGHRLELYCTDCGKNLCLICLATKHRNHECQEIVDLHVEFKKRLQSDVKDICSQKGLITDQLEKINEMKLEYNSQLIAREYEIHQTASCFKQVIDGVVQQMLAGLKSGSTKVTKETSSRISQLEHSLATRTSFLNYCQRLLGSDKPCDVTEAYRSLQSRAEELKKDKNLAKNDKYTVPQIPDKADDLYNRVFAMLNVKFTAKIKSPLPEDTYVTGLATLEGQLFVSYMGRQTLVIYDTVTHNMQYRLSIPGLSTVADMASCQRYQCVYIADRVKNAIRRLERKTNGSTVQFTVSEWAAGIEPSGLSVTVDYNVVVTFADAKTIKVFTTLGKPVKVIEPDQSILFRPLHAVQLTTDKYVVCFGEKSRSRSDATQTVCIVDDTGKVQQSFGGSSGSGEIELRWPSRLAVVNGFIYIVDVWNRRVLMLTSTLRYVRTVASDFRGFPRRIWFDEHASRLYLSEHELKNDVKRNNKYTWIDGHVNVCSVGS